MDTFGDLLEYRARAHGQRTALVFGDRHFTYFEMNRIADQAANFLAQQGLAANDRFGVLDFNSPEIVHLFHGALKLGAVPVFANWRFTVSELQFILEDAAVKVFFCDAEFDEISKQLAAKNDFPTISMKDFSRGLREQSEIPAWDRKVNVQSTLIQLYTSGTTGYPKGVPLTHGNMLLMLRDLALELPGFGADAVNLVCGPFFNIAGAAYWSLGLTAGICNVLLRRFDPALVAQTIARQRVTNVFLAPAMIQAVLGLPDVRGYDFSSLCNIHYGGSPIPEPLLRKAAETFGCKFTQGYGLTETTGIATLLRYDDHEKCLAKDADAATKRRLASAGRALPHIQLSVQKENGEQVAVGELGEVCIRGEHVASGYWNRPEQNAQAFDARGWFFSGDIGLIDAEGFLYLYDRKNDMIVSKGVNIYPAEVERVYFEHPDIADLAVIGVPDEEYGEAVCAMVVPRAGAALVLATLQAWGRDRLAGYKLPRRLEVVGELPRNPSGKVLRRELREPFWRGRERKI